jgi:hypothetical protein
MIIAAVTVTIKRIFLIEFKRFLFAKSGNLLTLKRLLMSLVVIKISGFGLEVGRIDLYCGVNWRRSGRQAEAIEKFEDSFTPEKDPEQEIFID